MIKYLKWSATVICIVGAFINAMGMHPLGPIILIIGGLNWLIVSIMWKETSLIITNICMTVVSIAGLLISIQ